MLQYATLADTVYFHFGANDTAGSGADGATPLAYVRLAGAAADAAPVYPTSPATLVPTLLTHANYPPGAHEIAIAATVANGFAAGSTYAVFCTLLVDSQNPTGFVGSFKLGPVPSDVTKWLGATAPAMSGDAYAVVNHATYGNSALHTDVADVHTDVGTALTNIADLHTDVGTAISQTTAATLVTALWDLADGIEIDLTPRQAARAVVARAGFGLISGAGTGVETVKGAGVTTTRLVLTDDSSGNITAAAATLT